MRALAVLLRHLGIEVRGSDRARDRGENVGIFSDLSARGMALFPQDGSGVAPGVGCVVVSTAIEPSVPDVARALALGIPVRRRAEVLAGLFARYPVRAAVGGTSGKSTVTAMLGHILDRAGLDPTVVNGAAPASGGEADNTRCGSREVCVIEADESDGSLALYRPTIAVLTNVTLDHQPLEALRPLFRDFLERAESGVVVNRDCPESRALTPAGKHRITFSMHDDTADLVARHVSVSGHGMAFDIGGVPVQLPVPGRHNVANALAAVGAAELCGVKLPDAASALADFPGVRRRLNLVGTAGGIAVVDDFAHNPDKIRASLAALHEIGYRPVVAVYQPHGFGPTRFLRAGLVDAFVEGLRPDDLLVLLDIFYAGGSAARDISSSDLVADIVARGGRAILCPDREAATAAAVSASAPGGCIAVMGARDDSLTLFAEQILTVLRAIR